MSGHFDGRNGRLSKTLRDLKISVGDGIVAVLSGKFFLFEEIFSLRRSVGDGIVAVLPGKFFF